MLHSSYILILKQMELPDDILQLVRAFSKPIGTRKDWRTCKQHESSIIYRHNRFSLNLCNYHFMDAQTMCQEIQTWSLYGRQRIMRNIFRYQELWQPVTPEPDWYEHRALNYDWQSDELATQANGTA